LVERAAIRPRYERLAPEHQQEHLEPMILLVCRQREQALVEARHTEHGSEIDLEELLGHRPSSGEVEPPAGAVGQKAPA